MYYLIDGVCVDLNTNKDVLIYESIKALNAVDAFNNFFKYNKNYYFNGALKSYDQYYAEYGNFGNNISITLINEKDRMLMNNDFNWYVVTYFDHSIELKHKSSLISILEGRQKMANFNILEIDQCNCR